MASPGSFHSNHHESTRPFCKQCSQRQKAAIIEAHHHKVSELVQEIRQMKVNPEHHIEKEAKAMAVDEMQLQGYSHFEIEEAFRIGNWASYRVIELAREDLDNMLFWKRKNLVRATEEMVEQLAKLEDGGVGCNF